MCEAVSVFSVDFIWIKFVCAIYMTTTLTTSIIDESNEWNDKRKNINETITTRCGEKKWSIQDKVKGAYEIYSK